MSPLPGPPAAVDTRRPGDMRQRADNLEEEVGRRLAAADSLRLEGILVEAVGTRPVAVEDMHRREDTRPRVGIREEVVDTRQVAGNRGEDRLRRVGNRRGAVLGRHLDRGLAGAGNSSLLSSSRACSCTSSCACRSKTMRRKRTSSLSRDRRRGRQR